MNEKVRQQKYGRALRGRFIRIRAEMRRGIVERDIFGLETSASSVVRREQLAPDFDPADLTPVDFDPGDDARNHDRFMAWLRRQQRQGVLELVSRDGNLYVRNAAADGVRWANARLREQGFNVTDGVEATLDAPQNANTLRLLYQRNYELLEGLTSDVASQVSEELTRGLAQGLGTDDIARNIADRINSVGLHRSTLIARNEVMYASNQMALNRYRDFGVERVEILGSDPCPQCLPHVGQTYAVDDPPSFGFPPYHPQCVCTVSPVV